MRRTSLEAEIQSLLERIARKKAMRQSTGKDQARLAELRHKQLRHAVRAMKRKAS